MDESHNVLPLTVHLLTSSGDSFALQQAIDQILHKICPDVRLFLVSEQAAPAKRYESQKKRLEFPGISVTLFLREDLGDERISLLQGFFHSPPWNHISIDLQRERYSFFNQPDGDFYSLDLHMPVWGIRQVHYGAEIVRLTLYCSCDNYEDAVRLYETILQKEAMVQKIGFCLFVVHSTKHTAVQLSLKQLHPGVSVQVKDSCALQFLVHEIGQLVPLLPYPCVPISDTRWQTQDYDGNKILLLVTNDSTLTQGPSEGKASQELRVKPVASPLLSFRIPNKRMQPGGQIVWDYFKSKQTITVPCKALDQRENVCCSSSNPSQKLVTRRSLQVKETETNVDTGFTVENVTGQQAFVCRFSRDLQNIKISEDNYFSALGCKSTEDLPSEQVDSPFPASVKMNKGLGKGNKMFHLERSQTHHSDSKEQDKEFFI